MKTTTRTATRSAMARLARARPPVADRSEGIVPRAERAQLLRSILEAPPSSAPTAPPPLGPVAPPADPSWVDPMPPAPALRRPLLAGALVATMAVAGLAMAGVVAGGDQAAQISAGPGEGRLPALAPPGGPAGLVPTDLPDGVVLQQVSVEPAVPPLPGSPYLEVYGRMGPEGAVEEAVAVITAAQPHFVDALVESSGAKVSLVPGQANQLDIDFGQSLVARSRTPDRSTACGTGGCVEIVEQGLSVMVLGRDLPGGAAALPPVLDALVLAASASVPGERVEAPALLAGGYLPLYEGDQIPGLSPALRTVLSYGDQSGRLSVTLGLEEGRVDPASLAWQFPESRPVEVRGHEGLLMANGLLTSLRWQERPGLTVFVDVAGLSESEALAIADSLEEVSEDEWRALGGGHQDAVVSSGPARSGPEGS